MEVKEYKCPNCGGAVKFDSATQNMKCPYCDAEFGIAALEEYQKEISVSEKDQFGWEGNSDIKEWDSEELNELNQGSCPSCGAELLGDKNTAAMVCPNCGNTQIVLRRLTGLLKPEIIIPFKLDKKAAVEALKNFYKGKKLLPDFFNKENRINSIQGLYLPFWFFDATANGHIRFKASKTKTRSDTKYNYSETNFYSVVRDGNIKFEKVPVDGSEKMDNAYMDAIEPFNYADIKDFQTAFLSGYIAEKYDVDAETSKERAAQRIKKSLEDEFRASVTGYSSVSVESSTINSENVKAVYGLLPVWILNTIYNKENYIFLMNGQTGRFIGKLPVDKGKLRKYNFLITGIIGAVFTIIIQLLRILG